jgi:hypothetical protein
MLRNYQPHSEILKNPKLGKGFGGILLTFEEIGNSMRSKVKQNCEMGNGI